MLKIADKRETRVFQEGVEEGMEKGIAIAIAKMAARKMSVEEIAAILELDVDAVRHALSQSNRN